MDPSSACARRDTFFRHRVIRAAVRPARPPAEVPGPSLIVHLFLPPPSRFRRGRMFGEPAHLPERTLRERGRLVPMRLRGGLHRIGRRPVLRRHGRVRPERHVHQRQVHQHGRLVQVRLRRRLQTLVGRQNLLRYRPPTHLHSILIHNRASG